LESFSFVKSEAFEWIREISGTYNFKNSMMKKNIPKEHASAWIKSIFKQAQLVKQQSIKEFGILIKYKHPPKKKKKKS